MRSTRDSGEGDVFRPRARTGGTSVHGADGGLNQPSPPTRNPSTLVLPPGPTRPPLFEPETEPSQRSADTPPGGWRRDVGARGGPVGTLLRGTLAPPTRLAIRDRLILPGGNCDPPEGWISGHGRRTRKGSVPKGREQRGSGEHGPRGALEGAPEFPPGSTIAKRELSSALCAEGDAGRQSSSRICFSASGRGRRGR